MKNWLRYIATAVTILLAIPLTAIYEQNIQKFAEEHGLDSLLKKGVGNMVQSNIGIILLFTFAFLLGATAALWAEFFLRKRLFNVLLRNSKEILENKKFRHERVIIDNKSFRGCTFEGVTLVYEGQGLFDFIGCHFGVPLSIDVNHPIAQGGFQLARFVAESGAPIIENRIDPMVAMKFKPPHSSRKGKSRPKDPPA